MQMYTEKQMRRKNFFLSPDLDDRATAVAKHLDLDFSELVRITAGSRGKSRDEA